MKRNTTNLGKRRGMTLVELLAVICVIVVLMGILLPATVKAYNHCKAWAYGCWAFNSNRLNVFVGDDDYYAILQQWYLLTNNHPEKWTFIKVKADGTIQVN